MKYNNLVLFDLDNTLIPIDSDYQWVNFLADNSDISKLDANKIKDTNNQLMNLYNKNQLKADQTAKFMLSLLAKIDVVKLAELHEIFMLKIIRPAIKKNAISLVKNHLKNNDICVIVTATNEFVTYPIARAFGIQNLIATKLEYKFGKYTGNLDGIINFQEGKIHNVNKWLEQFGQKISDFKCSYFYSDSLNDLPLLEIVTHPIATNPSLELRQLATKRNWKIIDLFTDEDKNI
ncbi:putative phosphatase [Candidatus Kinetoplastibacterium sorsogonicusi]|uniref:Putative phosphatase n=1 Tax=Candidatus Kinetoplastidibacterium kentomonadis TaxID=1576550 RepID=A0A3Q8ERK2_9PROT|nr:HAD family hydrolase [Candidatus Kinetoplastibacterium sorsogonicusi]AWD32647.1 putative phosphatase [Candidatus Kinetoplastibacterium sorsogonicusi]